MTAFVLVHGAWGGAHTWRGVRPRLWAAGHPVFTPSLTGIGERSHLTGPHVDLSVHIDDVVNTILYEDLDQIVLVGFSYGGMVVTGALEHIADRVRHLVYLDAFVPADGQSIADLTGAFDPDGTAPAPTGEPGWSRPAIGPSTIRPRRPSRHPAARRNRCARSPNRCDWSTTTRVVPVRPHLHQGTRRRPQSGGPGRLLGRRRPLPRSPRLATGRASEQPHDPAERPGRSDRDPAVAGVATATQRWCRTCRRQDGSTRW